MWSEDNIRLFEGLETPFYYYDMGLLDQTLLACKAAADKHDFRVHYALKANFNDPILKHICQSGFGADCVSGNEVKKAIKIGFKPDKVVFAGVGKSDKEILTALKSNIFCFNVESLQELEIIDGLAKQVGRCAKLAIRVNPNVDADTHKSITTGLDENKFGINQWELEACIERLGQLRHVSFIGIHFHIGSQITHLDVFEKLCLKVNQIRRWFDQQGFSPQILNVGGGLGVNYINPEQELIPNFEAYFQLFNRYLERKPGQEVHFELGRSLVAQCGTLVSRVLYIKNGHKKNFMILDAGMTELMRPALYQAYHYIENISKIGTDVSPVKYDIVGPICESTDCFATDYLLPLSGRGHLIAIRSAGAYGEVLASGYNLRDRVRAFYAD